MRQENQTIPFKYSQVMVNVLTTILPCLGFIWGMAKEQSLMELRITFLEKAIVTSIQDRAQLHEMLSSIDKKAEKLESKDDICASKISDVKTLLEEHVRGEKR